MSLWGALTGSDARRAARGARDANTTQLNAGNTALRGIYGQGYDAARGYLEPYQQGGQQAYGQYQNMLGLNGQGAQQGSMAAYNAANPYLAAEQDRTGQALDRRAAATGQFGSGLNALAKARAFDEAGYRNYTDYMNRLQGLSSGGASVAGQLSNLEMQNAGNLGNVEQWYRSGNMGNMTNYYNARAAANQGAAQNVLGLAGTAISAMAGMPVSFGGGSTQPGTMANGGWATTTTPANNFFSMFGR